LAGGFALFGTGSPSVPEWNRTLDPSGRFGAAMKADDLFQVGPADWSGKPKSAPGWDAWTCERGCLQNCNTFSQHYVSVINHTRPGRTGRDISQPLFSSAAGLFMTLPDDGFDSEELELAMWIVAGLILVACAVISIVVALLY
jgi:hypothetical protein